MTTQPILLVETRGAVRWLTINRPEQMNQVVWELFDVMIDAVRTAQADPAIRAIVLTGAGDRFFCGGGDLRSDEERGARGTDWLTHPIVRLFQTIEACTLPIIARVNGHAVAPGLSLLAMVDLAVATERASFGMPEARVGLVNLLGLAYLQRLVPRRKLLELMLTAEPIGAAEALAIGLVSYVVPSTELDAKLNWLIGRIIDKSPDAQRRGKHAFRMMQDMPLPQAMAFGSNATAPLLMTEDFRVGMQAFNERRNPEWPNRKTEFIEPLFDLSGQIALVTGATRGIGRAIAVRLLEHGARVAVHGRDQARCDEVAGELTARGGTAIGAALDLRQVEQLPDLIDRIEQALGTIDILVANAGLAPHVGPLRKVTSAGFDETIVINLKSTAWLANLVLPKMAQRRRGAIIVIGSISGIVGERSLGVYGLAKAAEMQLVRNIAVEYGPFNIRANAIAPGLVRTDISKPLWSDPAMLERITGAYPLRRAGEPDDIAGVAVFLASRAAAFMTGQTLVVDGGGLIGQGTPV